ncbi:uncharacterized protein LOC131166131 [Malania oleifera]|uniref:uncharacterized protein LOC131166131 n=1 Tax=Malania oleifera TaxID=397392 RepID=UPI0025ADB40C|nr:uncharacterized protein LOC131166131 [Malania oleifera]
MALRPPSLLATVRSEAMNPNGLRNPNPGPLPRLSISKPSWVVKSESNVHKEGRRRPDPPCVVCEGSGRVDCHHCCGKGRTNGINLEMLPRGEWPKWCRTCGGSGLGNCSRCLGTGEYRYIMGFHFMKIDSNHDQDQKPQQVKGNSGCHSAADLLINGDQSV